MGSFIKERRSRDRRTDGSVRGGRRSYEAKPRPNQALDLSGIFPALVTPMQADLTVDLDRMADHARSLIARGCHGVSVLGLIGEAQALSTPERMGLLDGLTGRGIAADKLLVGTGCSALSDTVALTKHAIDLGVRGVLILPPFIARGVGDDGLFAYFSEVFQRVGSDRLKACLYHYPQVAGLAISPQLIKRLLEHYPKTVCGIKDSSDRLDSMLKLIDAFPGFSVFTGSDDLLQPLLQAGGAGAITGVGNLAPEISMAVFNNWEYDGAKTHHRDLTTICKVFSAYPTTAAIKAVLAHYREEPGWQNLRPPLVPLDDDHVQDLLATLGDIGFTPT